MLGGPPAAAQMPSGVFDPEPRPQPQVAQPALSLTGPRPHIPNPHVADAEWMIRAREGKESRRVWVTSSTDYGDSWAKPKEITSQVKRRSWTWYAVGPGAGVQLSNGRLLVPANHAEDVTEYDRPYLPHINRSRMVRCAQCRPPQRRAAAPHGRPAAPSLAALRLRRRPAAASPRRP
eukprot:4663468-Prymnesium_polylepis.1